MNKFLSSVIILAFALVSCDISLPTEVKGVWEPPFLPIAVVFSKDGIDFEFQLGVQIPYIGKVSLQAPLTNNERVSRVLYVTINDVTHEYDINAQSDKKFKGIRCESLCEIGFDIAPDGNIILNISDIGSVKNAMPISSPGNFNLNLIVSVDAANIRESPDGYSNEIGGAYKGDILKSDGFQQTSANDVAWYRIIVPSGNYGAGKEGWISSKCVQIAQ